MVEVKYKYFWLDLNTVLVSMFFSFVILSTLDCLYHCFSNSFLIYLNFHLLILSVILCPPLSLLRKDKIDFIAQGEKFGKGNRLLSTVQTLQDYITVHNRTFIHINKGKIDHPWDWWMELLSNALAWRSNSWPYIEPFIHSCPHVHSSRTLLWHLGLKVFQECFDLLGGDNTSSKCACSLRWCVRVHARGGATICNYVAESSSSSAGS